MGYRTEQASIIIMKVLSIAVFLFGMFLSMLAFRQKNIFLLLVFALPFGVVASCMFVRYFLPGVAEFFSDFLIMPRRFLDKAPMILSSHYGNLANGAYQKVIDDMQTFPAHAFRNTEVVFIYAQACMNTPGYEEEGLQQMERFFRSARREKENKENIRLLMFYADSARSRRPPVHIAHILKKESSKNCYTEIEKRAIRTRCAALGKGIQA